MPFYSKGSLTKARQELNEWNLRELGRVVVILILHIAMLLLLPACACLYEVFLGTSKHEETSYKAFESIFKFFEEKEAEFDEAKRAQPTQNGARNGEASSSEGSEEEAAGSHAPPGPQSTSTPWVVGGYRRKNKPLKQEVPDTKKPRIDDEL